MGKFTTKKNRIEEEKPKAKPKGILKKIVKTMETERTAPKQKKIRPQKTAIKQKPLDKALVLKTFNKQFKSQTTEEKKLSRAQRKRQSLKKGVMKKKFAEFVKASTVKDKPQPFKMDSFNEGLLQIEKQNQMSIEQQQLKKHEGTKSSQREKHQVEDIKKMSEILKFAPFQNNPLGTLKIHIRNQLQMQGKI